MTRSTRAHSARARSARMLVAVVVIALLALGCGPVQQAAKQIPRYGDDVLKGIGKLTGKSTDEAAKFLDDAKQAGRFTPEAEVAVATWSTKVSAIADDLATKHFTAPDDQAAARSFIVGTTCDAFEKLEAKKRAGTLLPSLTPEEITALVDKNRQASELPSGVGMFLFVVQVESEIEKALKDSDLTSAFPAIARLTTCQVLG